MSTMAFAHALPRIYWHVINALIKSMIWPVYLILSLPDMVDSGHGRGDLHKAGDECKDMAKIYCANAFFVVQHKSQHEFQFVLASDAVSAVGIETELQVAVNSIMLNDVSLCDQVQIYDEELSKLGPMGKNWCWSLIMQVETCGNSDVVVSDHDLIPINKNKMCAVEYCIGPWALIPPNVKAIMVDLHSADVGFMLKAMIQIVCHLPKEHLRSLGVGGELDTFSMVTLMQHLLANLTQLSFFGPTILWNVANVQKYAKYQPWNLHKLVPQDMDLLPSIMMILKYLKLTMLRSLSLRNMRLKDKDLILLKQHWPDRLKKLDVLGNVLTDAGIITFMTGMPKSLMHLNIDHNLFVGDCTIKALTKSWPLMLMCVRAKHCGYLMGHGTVLLQKKLNAICAATHDQSQAPMGPGNAQAGNGDGGAGGSKAEATVLMNLTIVGKAATSMHKRKSCMHSLVGVVPEEAIDASDDNNNNDNDDDFEQPPPRTKWRRPKLPTVAAVTKATSLTGKTTATTAKATAATWKHKSRASSLALVVSEDTMDVDASDLEMLGDEDLDMSAAVAIKKKIKREREQALTKAAALSRSSSRSNRKTVLNTTTKTGHAITTTKGSASSAAMSVDSVGHGPHSDDDDDFVAPPPKRRAVATGKHKAVTTPAQPTPPPPPPPPVAKPLATEKSTGTANGWNMVEMGRQRKAKAAATAEQPHFAPMWSLGRKYKNGVSAVPTVGSSNSAGKEDGKATGVDGKVE